MERNTNWYSPTIGIALAALLALGGLFVIGCSTDADDQPGNDTEAEEGTFEQAGEEVDEALEDAARETGEAMNELGEDIEDAGEDMEEDNDSADTDEPDGGAGQ